MISKIPSKSPWKTISHRVKWKVIWGSVSTYLRILKNHSFRAFSYGKTLPLAGSGGLRPLDDWILILTNLRPFSLAGGTSDTIIYYQNYYLLWSYRPCIRGPFPKAGGTSVMIFWFRKTYFKRNISQEKSALRSSKIECFPKEQLVNPIGLTGICLTFRGDFPDACRALCGGKSWCMGPLNDEFYLKLFLKIFISFAPRRGPPHPT